MKAYEYRGSVYLYPEGQAPTGAKLIDKSSVKTKGVAKPANKARTPRSKSTAGPSAGSDTDSDW